MSAESICKISTVLSCLFCLVLCREVSLNKLHKFTFATLISKKNKQIKMFDGPFFWFYEEKFLVLITYINVCASTD